MAKTDFLSFQGTVQWLHLTGTMNKSKSARFCVPKNIQIGSFLAQLFEKLLVEIFRNMAKLELPVNDKLLGECFCLNAHIRIHAQPFRQPKI